MVEIIKGGVGTYFHAAHKSGNIPVFQVLTSHRWSTLIAVDSSGNHIISCDQPYIEMDFLKFQKYFTWKIAQNDPKWPEFSWSNENENKSPASLQSSALLYTNLIDFSDAKTLHRISGLKICLRLGIYFRIAKKMYLPSLALAHMHSISAYMDRGQQYAYVNQLQTGRKQIFQRLSTVRKRSLKASLNPQYLETFAQWISYH